MEYPSIQIGDHVRTLRPFPRLRADRIGTIAKICDPNGLLGVLFDSDIVPRFMYRAQLDVRSAQDAKNS
jgi:hypothetical protein